MKRKKNKFDEVLEQNSVAISMTDTKYHLAVVVAKLMMDNDAYDSSFLGLIHEAKDVYSAKNIIFNRILKSNGDGVLKGYSQKVVPFKGSAIHGMECHSS